MPQPRPWYRPTYCPRCARPMTLGAVSAGAGKHTIVCAPCALVYHFARRRRLPDTMVPWPRPNSAGPDLAPLPGPIIAQAVMLTQAAAGILQLTGNAAADDCLAQQRVACHYDPGEPTGYPMCILCAIELARHRAALDIAQRGHPTAMLPVPRDRYYAATVVLSSAGALAQLHALDLCGAGASPDHADALTDLADALRAGHDLERIHP